MQLLFVPTRLTRAGIPAIQLQSFSRPASIFAFYANGGFEELPQWFDVFPLQPSSLSC
jgi:hypothetical protein